jgi:hypothetical protein
LEVLVFVVMVLPPLGASGNPDRRTVSGQFAQCLV